MVVWKDFVGLHELNVTLQDNVTVGADTRWVSEIKADPTREHLLVLGS